MKPPIYLSNAASKRTKGHHGPGAMICAMAKPRRWEWGSGVCRLCAPLTADLEAVQAGAMPVSRYREHCETAFSQRGLSGYYFPGTLFFRNPLTDERSYVRTGDTLICGCARWAEKKKRAHPCHLELLAPHLHAAGWEVVLWGTIYNPAIHTPSFFGWPNV